MPTALVIQAEESNDSPAEATDSFGDTIDAILAAEIHLAKLGKSLSE